jgi:hypothetical protein
MPIVYAYFKVSKHTSLFTLILDFPMMTFFLYVLICSSQEIPLYISTSQSLKMLLNVSLFKVSKNTLLYTHMFWFEMTILFMCQYQYLYRSFSIVAHNRVTKDNILYMPVF